MKKNLPILVLLALAAIFAYGVTQLFKLRFEAGDIYPAYSSLRADPLGTMALYESLGKMPGITVRRDFSETDQLPEEKGTVYMHLAATPEEWKWMPDDLYREVQDFLARGGRLVVAFYPQMTAPYHNRFEDENQTNDVKSVSSRRSLADKPAKKNRMNGEDDFQETDLESEWGFHESFTDLSQGDDAFAPVMVKNKSDLLLPGSLAWHSGMIFTNCDSAWHIIYARDSHAVVMERKFGQGSVVMASDSYFLSNEAMEGDRHAEFLAWLVGSNRNVVFDEAHLGITESPGVAALMRKYRLHGLAAALLVLAGLFIWKNSLSLVPPSAEERRASFVVGKDSAAAFVNLLRRSVKPADLLAVCFAEWKKNVTAGGRVSAGRLQQAEAIFQADNSLPSRERNGTDTYREITAALSHGNKKL